MEEATTTTTQLPQKERRILKLWESENDPILFSYNKQKSKDGVNYGISSKMRVGDLKRAIGNGKWLGKKIPAICLQLFTQNEEDERLEGPLDIRKTIGSYLDGNDYTLIVRYIPLPF